NTMPLSRLWIPMLDKWWGWVVFFILLAGPSLLALKIASLLGGPSLPGPLQKIYNQWMGESFNFAVRMTPRVFWLMRIFLALVIWVSVLCWPSIPAALFWFIYGFRGWFGLRAAELRRRKQLAALFCLQDGTGPDGIERYVHDDELYAERVGRFLQHHQLR